MADARSEDDLDLSHLLVAAERPEGGPDAARRAAHHRRRLRRLVGTGVLVALGATSVGVALGRSGGTRREAVLSVAATRLEAAGTARMTAELAVAILGRPEPRPIVIDGVIDFSHHRASLTSQDVIGSGFDAVVDGDVTYSKLSPDLYPFLPPAVRQLATNGPVWMRQVGTGTGGLNASNLDATALLNALRTAGAVVSPVGGENVRGVRTAHFRTDVDLDQLQQVGGQLAQAARSQPAPGTQRVPIELWIDEHGLLRRLRFSFVKQVQATQQTFSNAPATGAVTTVPPQRVTETRRTTQTLELYDFGTPVSIVIPPSEQVIDATQLASARNSPTPAP